MNGSLNLKQKRKPPLGSKQGGLSYDCYYQAYDCDDNHKQFIITH